VSCSPEGDRPREKLLSLGAQAHSDTELIAIFLRTGRWARRAKLGPWNVGRNEAGYHASVAPWLKDRGVSFLGSDSAQDVTPSRVEGITPPVHTLAITPHGIHILDNQDLEHRIPPIPSGEITGLDARPKKTRCESPLNAVYDEPTQRPAKTNEKAGTPSANRPSRMKNP